MNPDQASTTISDYLLELPDRIAVLATNLLTWLIAAQTVITIVVTQAETLGLSEAAEYATLAATALTSVILFVRRVTPVPANEKGLLPAAPSKRRGQ